MILFGYGFKACDGISTTSKITLRSNDVIYNRISNPVSNACGQLRVTSNLLIVCDFDVSWIISSPPSWAVAQLTLYACYSELSEFTINGNISI